jgi:hypothetical protein
MSEGVDFSFSQPSPLGLKKAGKIFACVYGGPGSVGKQPTLEYVQALHACGIATVALAEGAVRGALRGRGQGRDDAARALLHFAQLGMPTDRPIFFAVDWDATDVELRMIESYFAGVEEVLPLSRIGVYGGIRTIDWALGEVIASWGFQAYAWSNGQWHPRAHIRQYRNHVPLAGGEVDLCRSMTTDFGQWGVNPDTPGNLSGDTMSTAEDVWAHEFGSPALSVEAWSAADWLKYAYSTYRDTQQILGKLAAISEHMAEFAAPVDLTAVMGILDSVAGKVQRLIDAPVVDAVAVAKAIEASPEIAATLARAVAAQLDTITGSVSLSGSLSARMALPPA